MKEEKKVAKKATKTTAKAEVKAEPKKVTKPSTKKATNVKDSKPAKAVKAEKVKNAQPVVEVTGVKQVEQPVAKVDTKEHAKKITLHQDLNLVIGLCSLIMLISFCFAFQGGDVEVLGWELLLKGGEYSGVFKGLMILYVVSLFIDCILAIRIDTENEIFNIIEKALYMFTAIMNFVVVAVLLSLISKVGMGLIVFFIISIVSVIIKFARIYSK